MNALKFLAFVAVVLIGAAAIYATGLFLILVIPTYTVVVLLIGAQVAIVLILCAIVAEAFADAEPEDEQAPMIDAWSSKGETK